MKNKRIIRQAKFLLVCILLLIILFFSSILLIAGNELGKIRAVSTPNSIPSPTHTPTSTGTPQPLFSDDFTDKSKGWSVGDNAGYTRNLHDNTLTLTDTNHKVLVESLPTSTIFDDFSVTVTFSLLQADEHDSVGLYLRGDSNLDHDYRVEIFGNNTYAISKESLDSSNDLEQMFLAHPLHTSALKPQGQQNTLTVMMKASTMVVLINGTVVHSVTDSDYKHGQIALFVENGPTSDGVTASFYNIVIYPAPDSLPI